MKKKVIIAIVVLVAAALIIVPMMNNGGEEVIDNPVVFGFEQNLQLSCNETAPIEVVIASKEVATVEVRYDDSLVFSANSPKSNITFDLKGEWKGVGAKKLTLVSTLSDGTKFTDARMVRVLSDITPVVLKAEITNTYPHNEESFTQGLEFYNGKLYESTGLLGKSKVFQVDLKSGKINESLSMGLDGTHFGEGITILNDVIYQLTWQNRKCITYDLGESIVPKGEFSYTGEGWGICNDGKSLIMSNGTEHLVFRNPETFLVEKTIEVYSNSGPQVSLNELEFIDGYIYANVWMTDRVVVIDPASGKIHKVIDGSELVKNGQGVNPEVMNGIAYNSETGKTYMTGKNWMALFEVSFVQE